jgi:hypothetical protein
MLRVAKISLVAVPLFALLTVAACGGKKPPAPPSMEALDASADADMPAPPSTVGLTSDAGPASDAGSSTTETPPAPASIALPTATAKATLKGKKPGAVEIKSDGSVSSGGKVIGKISGMAMQSPDGKDLLKVGSDGAVTTDGGTAYGSFSGDELTLAKGDKVSVGDDGAVTMTTGGKAAPLGKFENLGAAKKAAALAVAFLNAPPAAEKPATPAKPTGKPTGKPVPKKP